MKKANLEESLECLTLDEVSKEWCKTYYSIGFEEGFDKVLTILNNNGYKKICEFLITTKEEALK